ncbi:MAG: AAA family ATPase [Dokdonella sp.]|uniref:AAA family ATPase n=1 Tax=Dokdonella sp. TaxID=2291710 RepID=UPI003BB1529F
MNRDVRIRAWHRGLARGSLSASLVRKGALVASHHTPLNASPAPPAGEAFPLGPELAARPIVIAVMGLPGAGKSIVARAIEDQLRLRRVCRDQIRAAMFPRCNYSFIEKRAAYRSVLLALEINCMLRVGSVIDGMTFSRRSELDRVAEVADKHGIATIPLLVECPPELARERVARDMAANRHTAGDRTPETVNDVLARRDPPPEGTLVVDATLSAAQMCRSAIAAIRESIAAAASAGK